MLRSVAGKPRCIAERRSPLSSQGAWAQSIPPIAADHINADPLPTNYAPDINQALIEKSRTNDYSARTTNITVMLTPAAAQRYVSSVCRRYRLLIGVPRPRAFEKKRSPKNKRGSITFGSKRERISNAEWNRINFQEISRGNRILHTPPTRLSRHTGHIEEMLNRGEKIRRRRKGAKA